MKSEKNQKLREEIKKLKTELEEREASIPAHSVRPRQLQAIEDLEVRISEKEEELKLFED